LCVTIEVQRDERADHCLRDGGIRYELNLAVENIILVVIEADDKATKDLEPYVG
jgi:hypothetical protein